jgi:Zn-dependent M16 (insulinase) family peptidase
MLKSARKFATTSKLLRSCSGVVRGEARAPLGLKVGDTQHQFELVAKQHYPELDITLHKFVHKDLGTRHYHVDAVDTNNCFAFNFTTKPDDHTGKPHILEHLTLCGSKKYPVRDPFFNMIKRSLNTYMNAWTGPDFTSYPFSTANRADFYNLLSIYAESVFNPLLKNTDFMQEGWRLEFEDPATLVAAANQRRWSTTK